MESYTKVICVQNYLQTIIMAKPSKNKRHIPEKRFSTQPEGIEVYSTSTKFKKEEKERKQREQEATRESD